MGSSGSGPRGVVDEALPRWQRQLRSPCAVHAYNATRDRMRTTQRNATQRDGRLGGEAQGWMLHVSHRMIDPSWMVVMAQISANEDPCLWGGEDSSGG